MYDRKLIDYLPNVLKEIKEYQIIQNEALQPETTLMWQCTNKVLIDQFIETMSENGVKRWEKLLNIIPKGTLSLDERKFTIYTRLNENLPFTERMLEERLLNLCGKGNYSITLKENEYYIKILIGLKAKNNYDDVIDLINRIMPCNMKVECQLKYNQHVSLAKYTHKELSQYTILQVKEEVLHGNKYS